MKTTRRRYWVFSLLFLFNVMACVDRVNGRLLTCQKCGHFRNARPLLKALIEKFFRNREIFKPPEFFTDRREAFAAPAITP
jgi:hypothetical protein